MPRKPKLCSICGGSTEIAIRPTGRIDGTYPEGERWFDDERLGPCPFCWLNPWQMAKGTGQVVLTSAFGPILAVYYPHRKSADCYVSGPDDIIHCCQDGCEADFPSDELSSHIDLHDTRPGDHSGIMKRIMF